MQDLTPTEHLACFYRYCFTHYTRNIANLRGHVKENILSAMMALASANPLPNYIEVISTIRTGGKKALGAHSLFQKISENACIFCYNLDWLKDKELNNAFTLAAIYRPLSKMPLEIWKAAPPTSNGNKQAHRNINRDGIKLTMLAGIMHSLQFDSRAMGTLQFWIKECIPPRDQLSTHFRRSARAIYVKSKLHSLFSPRTDGFGLQ